MELSDYSFVPEELKYAQIWLPFRTSPRPSGGVNKIPYNACGRPAEYTNPSVWMTYRDALDVVRAGHAEGIGFVVTDGMGYVLHDFDHCLIAGVLDPKVAEWIRKLDTYTEWSYSGEGVHAIAKGELPWKKNKTDRIEMYADKRFFVVTGIHLESTPCTIESRQEAINAIHLAYFGPEPTSIPCLVGSSAAAEPVGGPGPTEQPRFGDEEVIIALRQLPAYASYWGGWTGPGNDPSRADYALGCRLAFLTCKNEAQTRRLMLRSGLNRPEYTHKRGHTDYLGYTINRCINTTVNNWDGSEDSLLLPLPPVKDASQIISLVQSPAKLDVTNNPINDITGKSGLRNLFNNALEAEAETALLLNRTWPRKTASREAVVSVLASHKGWVTLSTVDREAKLKGRAVYHQLRRLIAEGLVERKDASYRMIRTRKPRALKPCTVKPIPFCWGTTKLRKNLSRSALARRGWPTQMIDTQLHEEGRHYQTQTLPTRDNRMVTARYYRVDYILAAERQPGFEAERSRILHPPREEAKNAVMRLLINSNGRAQSNYSISLRTGLDPRIVPTIVKNLVKEGTIFESTIGNSRVYRMAFVDQLKVA